MGKIGDQRVWLTHSVRYANARALSWDPLLYMANDLLFKALQDFGAKYRGGPPFSRVVIDILKPTIFAVIMQKLRRLDFPNAKLLNPHQFSNHPCADVIEKA